MIKKYKSERELSAYIKEKLKLSPQALNSRLKKIKKKFPSQSRKWKLGIEACLNNLNLSDFFSDDEINKLMEHANEIKHKKIISKPEKSDKNPLIEKIKHLEGRTPYDYNLKEYGLNRELIKKVKRNNLLDTESIMMKVSKFLENYIQDKLNIPRSIHGKTLITKVRTKGVFQTGDKGEEEGLYFLFCGYIQWFRNKSHHIPIKESKAKSLEILMITNNLIELFDELCEKNIKK